MINLAEVTKISAYSGVVDLRKGASGLISLVGDVEDGALYLFSNRTRNLLKGLYRDEYGTRLSCCRLHRGSFYWPEHPGGKTLLSGDELCSLLEGQNLKMLIKRITLSGKLGKSDAMMCSC